MIKKIGILLFLLVSILSLDAQICSRSLETTSTVPIIQVGDYDTASVCSGPVNAINTTTDIVTLGINFNHPDYHSSAYLLEVDVKITPLPGTPFTIPLTIYRNITRLYSIHVAISYALFCLT